MRKSNHIALQRVETPKLLGVWLVGMEPSSKSSTTSTHIPLGLDQLYQGMCKNASALSSILYLRSITLLFFEKKLMCAPLYMLPLFPFKCQGQGDDK